MVNEITEANPEGVEFPSLSMFNPFSRIDSAASEQALTRIVT